MARLRQTRQKSNIHDRKSVRRFVGASGDVAISGNPSDGVILSVKWNNRWYKVPVKLTSQDSKHSYTIEDLLHRHPGNVTINGDLITENDSIHRNGGLTLHQAKIVCSLSDDTDANVAHLIPAFKLPAHGVIKSVGCVVETLSNLGTYNLALYVGTDTSRTDGQALTRGVDILVAGEATTKSGCSTSATNIDAGTSAGRIKTSWYLRPDIAFGAADKYVYAVMGASGNGDTNPTTSAVLRVFVEFIGID